ncbi:MAG: N-acetylmuramoyl-L-alanine amidase [Paenibacillaceae bacterium]
MAVLLLFPSQMYAMTVVIDPGHGGHDPGAIGVNGLKEKNINLDISKKLAQELNNMGYDTIMTRETDTYLTLQERVTFANRSGGDIFVSIHANSHPNESAHGTLVLYYDDAYPNANYPASSTMRLLSDENKALARSIQDDVILQVNTFDHGIVPSVVFVVRNGIMPSVLIETAFVSNKEDARLLDTESFRTAVASGIAKGISKYQPPIFYDLHNHWAKESILKLEGLGIVKGDNGAFHPNQQMTRAEFIAILDRLFSFDNLLNGMNNKEDEGNGQNVGGEETIKPDEEGIEVEEIKQYPDLTDKHWAYPIINMGVKLGIISGFEDGTIRPNDPISRAEMVVLFDKLALSATPTLITNQFVDVPEQSWYASSVYKMKELGYVHGLTDTSFAPNRQMSRAEGATIISRYLGSDNGLIVLNNLQDESVQ